MRLLDRLMRPWSSKSDVDVYTRMLELFGAQHRSNAGKVVTWQTALEVSTAFACARVIAEGIAQVPLKLFQEKDGKRLPATKHPLYDVLHRRPSALQTHFEFFETMAFHLVFMGNAYALKGIYRGDVAELIMLDPSTVTVKRDNEGALTYTIQLAGGRTVTLAADAVWHVRGPSWNSWMGLEAIKLARESLGLSMAIEEHQSRLHSNGAQTGGFLTIEGTLKETQYNELRAWLEKEHTGAANAGRPMIMDRGAKFVPNVQSGVDGQHLQTRQFQIEEICRHARVMPIMVGHSDKASTYASAEQMFLAHVVHTLSPWYQRIEESISAHLLTDADRANGIYPKFVEEGLLRANLTDTQSYLLGMVNGGLMTPNEGREKLDLNPDMDPDSNKLRIPANIVGEPAAEAAGANKGP